TSPDTVPTDGKCYVYTLAGTDRVGNTTNSFSSRISRHTTFDCDWSSDVCSSDLSNTYDNGAGTLYFRPSASGTFTVNAASTDGRSEERRVGKEYRSRRLQNNEKDNFGSTQNTSLLADTLDDTTTGPTTKPTGSTN